MKIHFSNVNFSSSTGPNTFAHRLAAELENRGHRIVGHTDDYDVFLSFIEAATKPDAGAVIVQRLDGIWFKPDQFHTHNRGIKQLYQFADAVIWQSEFDKNMTIHHWGEPKDGEIIRNGIRLGKKEITQHGIQRIRNEHGVVFVCSANWHPQKRLKDNIALFKRLQKTYDTSCLIVMGGNPEVVADPHIFYTGSLPYDVCLEIFSTADWMLHLAWLDHCPNTVVEALSQGTPVICTDAGGTKELVGTNGIVIPETPYNYELADYDNPPRLNFDLLPEELPEITVDNSSLDIVRVADKYENLFLRLMK